MKANTDFYRRNKYWDVFMIILYLCDISGICCPLRNLNHTNIVFCGVLFCRQVLPLLMSHYTAHLSHIPHTGFYWLINIGSYFSQITLFLWEDNENNDEKSQAVVNLMH